MHAVLTICFATLAAHLVGSAVLFGFISGPNSILVSPLLSMFGWFFLPLEILVIASQWALLAGGGFKQFFTAWVVTVPSSALLVAMIGPTVDDDYLRWSIAYAIATTAPTSLGLVLVAASKSIRALAPDAPARGEQPVPPQIAS